MERGNRLNITHVPLTIIRTLTLTPQLPVEPGRVKHNKKSEK